MKELIVLSHSGGLDSTTLLALALSQGKKVLPINYNYGQANIIEKQAQKNVWNYYKKLYPDTLLETINIDFTNAIGDALKTFQKNRDNGKTEEKTETQFYMPSRNLLFMSTSAVIGEIIAIDQDIESIELGLGIHKHSDIYAKDYWDITPAFAENLNNLLSLNDNINVSIFAPYKDKYKSELIKDAAVLKVPFELTWTCYDPVYIEETGYYVPCLICEACRERETQSAIAGIKNINKYQIKIPDDDTVKSINENQNISIYIDNNQYKIHYAEISKEIKDDNIVLSGYIEFIINDKIYFIIIEDNKISFNDNRDLDLEALNLNFKNVIVPTEWDSSGVVLNVLTLDKSEDKNE